MRFITRALRFVGYLGIVIFVASLIRWSFVYSDLSQSILGMLIGAVICAGGFIGAQFYEGIKLIEDSVNNLKQTAEYLKTRLNEINEEMKKSRA